MNGFLAGLARRVLDPPSDVRPRAALPFEGNRLEMPDDIALMGFPPDEVISVVEEGVSARAAVSVETAAARGPDSTRLSEVNALAAHERKAVEPAVTHAASETRPEVGQGLVSTAKEDMRAHVQEPARAQSHDTQSRVVPQDADTSTPPAPLVHLRRDPHGAPPTRTNRSLPTAVALTVGVPFSQSRRSTDSAAPHDERPVVQVSIGRIEVRAAPPVAAPEHRATAASSHLDLAEYLRQRDAGER
jgi:hypothetical protein